VKWFFDFLSDHQYKVFFLLSVLLGLIPLHWYRGFPLATEEYFGLDYAAWGRLFSEAWFSVSNYGGMNPMAFKFQGLVVQIIKSLGFNLLHTQMSWYILTWILSAAFMYVFLYKLFAKKVPGYILFLGTLFYVYTPFFLGISVLASPHRVLFAIMPLVGLLIYKYYTSKKIGTYISLFFLGVVLMLGSPIFANPPLGVALVMFPALSILFKNLVPRVAPVNFIKEFLFFVVVFVALNFWWLLPIFFVFTIRIATFTRFAGAVTFVDLKNISDTLSQFGLWAFRAKGGPSYFYYPYNFRYYELPVLFIRYIPFAIVLCGIFVPNKFHKQALFKFFGFALVLFLLLSKGSSGIGGDISKFLYAHAPLFWIFREPYAKFMPIVILTTPIFLVLGVDSLAKLLKKTHRQIPLFLFFTLVGINIIIMWPFFVTEMHFDLNEGLTRSQKVKFPDYWERLTKEWVPTDGLYLLYPTYGLHDYHMWPSGYIGNPYILLTGANTLGIYGTMDSNNTADPAIYYLYDLMLKDPEKFLRLAPRYNISGLILQKDLFGDFELTDKVEENYPDFLLHDYEKVKIYQFNAPSHIMESHPVQQVYKFDPEYHKVYSELKDQLPETAVLEYSADPTAISGLTQNTVQLPDGWKNSLWEDVGHYLDFDEGTGLHYKELPGFDQNKEYILSADGEFNVSYTIFLAIVQLDSDGNITAQHFQEALNTPGDIDVYIKPKIKTMLGDKYYFVIYPSRPQTFSLRPSRNYIDQIDIQLREKYSLDEKVLEELPFIRNDTYSTGPVESTKLSNSFYVAKHPGEEEFLLQFKQAYNQNWYRVPIDKKTYTKLVNNDSTRSSVILGLRHLLLRDGIEPINLEHYSNGWFVKDGYSFIYYFPTVLSNISYIFSISLIFIVSLYYIWRYKRKK
jgi:hypothetical protein